jgi:hypothetical protein
MKNHLKKNEIKNNLDDDIMQDIHLQQESELKKYKQDNIFLKNIYNYGLYILNYLYKTIKFMIKISGLYLIWIILHYTASHLYIKLCVPNTIVGFLMSPFMTATPHCQGLRWLIYNAAIMINNMWVLFGAWICSTLLFVNNDINNGDRN